MLNLGYQYLFSCVPQLLFGSASKRIKTFVSVNIHLRAGKSSICANGCLLLLCFLLIFVPSFVWPLRFVSKYPQGLTEMKLLLVVGWAGGRAGHQGQSSQTKIC